MGIGYPFNSGTGTVSSPRSLAGLTGTGISGDRGGDGGEPPGDTRPRRQLES